MQGKPIHVEMKL